MDGWMDLRVVVGIEHLTVLIKRHCSQTYTANSNSVQGASWQKSIQKTLRKSGLFTTDSKPFWSQPTLLKPLPQNGVNHLKNLIRQGSYTLRTLSDVYLNAMAWRLFCYPNWLYYNRLYHYQGGLYKGTNEKCHNWEHQIERYE